MIISQWSAPGSEAAFARDVRRAVFQQELHLPAEQVFDPADDRCWQLAFLDEGIPVAAGRIGYHSLGVAELSQICVVPDRRGEGLGDGVLKTLILKAETLGMKQAVACCTGDVAGFFETVEFRAESVEPETGIVTMRRELGIGFKCHCADQ